MMTCLKEITDQNNIFVSNVFKAKAKEKYDETFLGGVFFKNKKRTFSGVKNRTLKKSNFIFVFLCLFFNVKGSFLPIFTKNFNILGPLEFFEN